MRSANRILIALTVVTGAAAIGLIVSGGGHHRQKTTLVPAAPSPQVLRQIGTPKDLCSFRDFDDGRTELSEALEKYAKARSQGDHQEACLQASCAVDEYNSAVNRSFHPSQADLAYLAHWRELEQAECAAGGYLPRQH